MAEEYRQGMVSQLLRGGLEASGGKLASLFTAPPGAKQTQETAAHHKKKGQQATLFTTPPTTKQAQEAAPHHKKKKKREAECSDKKPPGAPPGKKARIQAGKAEVPVSSPSKKDNAQKKKKSKVKQKSKENGISVVPTTPAGYNPPPGVVHEALATGMSDEGDDSDEEQTKKGIKEDKRPRRDRLKKANEKRTVFVGNVPLKADKKVLGRLFKQFGEIESIRFRCAPVADPTTKKRVAVITKEFHDKRHNITAYVCFKEKESAEKALTLNGHVLDGFHLRVDAAKPNVKDLNKRSVFIGNLPFAIEEETIREHFEDCGEIENVRVVRDRKTNLGKGFCYILFKSADSVSLALHLKDSELAKRKLRVQRCSVNGTAKTDSKGKQLKQSNDRKTTTTRPKQKLRQQTGTNRSHPKSTKKTETAADSKDGQKAKRRKRMWQPTNASGSQVARAQRTALKKKQRKGEKKRKQRSKTDEVNRVLGPAPPQMPLKTGPKKGKPQRELKGGKKGKPERREVKGGKKGKPQRREVKGGMKGNKGKKNVKRV